ncbi:MAG: hypothetical protein QM539_05250 [Alphaproteobacteria bacterium]|nr:hypothetical protein [Alphaproteobacteria bacterium]
MSVETKISPAHNSRLAIGGVSSPLDSFVVDESSVLRTNYCAEKPAHRQSAKRYTQGYDDPTTNNNQAEKTNFGLKN